MGRVRQNLGLIIVPNAIAIVLGALGHITPPIAAVINNGATLLAVLVGAAPLLDAPRRRGDQPDPTVARARERPVRRERVTATGAEEG